MTDMRCPAWRSQHGLSDIEADNRLNEASRVIGSMGSLIPVMLSVEESEFNAMLRQDITLKPNKIERLEPDYICFLCFALAQLEWIHNVMKDVRQVDFWVERSSKKITKYISDFHTRLPDALRYIGSGHLAPLVGELQAVGKDRIPAQTADMLGWHARNLANGTLDQLGQKRYWRMTDGGDGRGRYGYRGGLNSDLLRNLAEALLKPENVVPE